MLQFRQFKFLPNLICSVVIIQSCIVPTCSVSFIITSVPSNSEGYIISKSCPGLIVGDDAYQILHIKVPQGDSNGCTLHMYIPGSGEYFEYDEIGLLDRQEDVIERENEQ